MSNNIYPSIFGMPIYHCMDLGYLFLYHYSFELKIHSYQTHNLTRARHSLEANILMYKYGSVILLY